MRIKTSVNRQGQIYIPRKIRESLGLVLPDGIVLIADAKSFLGIPENMSSKEALRSLEVIKVHLVHQAEIELEIKEKEK